MKSAFGSQRNTHLEHPEDLLVLHDDGVSVVKEIFSVIVYHLLRYKQTPPWLSIKYDGAPAVFYGRDPESGRFFVSTKSVFAANAKKAFRKKDITELWQWPLAQKLLTAWPYLKKWTGSWIIQWDLLFVRDGWDIAERIINETQYTTWRPNTLVYALESSSKEMQSFHMSNIWLINHTYYKCDASWALVLMQKTPRQIDSWAVWTPPLYPLQAEWSEELIETTCTALLEQTFALKKTYSTQLHTLLNAIDKRAERRFVVPAAIQDTSKEAKPNKKPKEPQTVTPIILPVRDAYMRRTNLMIRKWVNEQTPEQRFAEFVQRYLDEYAAKIAKLQRKRDIFRYELWKRAMRLFFARWWVKAIPFLQTQQQIITIKESLIDLIEKTRVPDIHCFLPQWAEYISTGHEWYVIRTPQWAIKLVKRAVFSRANFIEPKLWGKTVQNNTEAEKKQHWLLFFARMNPPTKQHIAFLRMMITMAQESWVPYYFFLSHTQDANNPLPQALKWAIIQAAIPEITIHSCGDEVKTLYDAVRFVSDAWITHVWLLWWADREEVIEELQEKKQTYGLEQITGIRLGDREVGKDVSNTKQISWTMTRQFARDGNYAQFIQCFDEAVPEQLIHQAYEAIRHEM